MNLIIISPYGEYTPHYTIPALKVKRDPGDPGGSLPDPSPRPEVPLAEAGGRSRGRPADQSARSRRIDFISGFAPQRIVYVSSAALATWTSFRSWPFSSQTYVTLTGANPPFGCL